MYKIILVFGLVLAVAEGFLAIEENTISDLVRNLTKENIKLARQRYDELLKNNTQIIHNLAKDFSEVTSELKDTVDKSEYFIIRDKVCYVTFNGLNDLKNHCFAPNVPYCKAGMWMCIRETGTQLGRLLNEASKIRAKLKKFKADFEKNIANCTFDVSNLEYEKCVNDEIFCGDAYVSENQKKFVDQIGTAVIASRELIKKLENSVTVFAGRAQEIIDCLSKHLGKREEWWSSIFGI